MHYKERSCLVEGLLSNLRVSLIQFSKPRKMFNEKYRRYFEPEGTAEHGGGNENESPRDGEWLIRNLLDETIGRGPQSYHNPVGYIHPDRLSSQYSIPTAFTQEMMVSASSQHSQGGYSTSDLLTQQSQYTTDYASQAGDDTHSELGGGEHLTQDGYMTDSYLSQASYQGFTQY